MALLTKIIKRFSFNKEKLKSYRWTRWIGPILFEPRYWQLRRQPVSKGVFIGLFCACLPVPIQVLIAVIWALCWRAYIPFAVGLVWLANPLTMPPLYYFCYKLGAWLLQTPEQHFAFHLNWHWFTEEVTAIWKPLLLGCGVCGLVIGGIAYYTIRLIWRCRITQRWLQRRRQHQQKLLAYSAMKQSTFQE